MWRRRTRWNRSWRNEKTSYPGDSGGTPSVEGQASAGIGPPKGDSVTAGSDQASAQFGGRVGVGFGAQASVGIGMSRTVDHPAEFQQNATRLVFIVVFFVGFGTAARFLLWRNQQ